MNPRTVPPLPTWVHRGLAAAWIALLWVPIVQMVFRPVPEGPATIENRSKAALPRLQGLGLKALTSFTAAFDKYFGDTFGFRDSLIRAHTILNVRGLRTSPLATIVIGREGWLYYNNAADGVNLLDYCGLDPLSEKDLATIERNLSTAGAELRRRGSVFAVVIPPNNHTVYPEHLPERIRILAGTTRLDQLASRLARNPEILFVDVRAALREKRGLHQLYFKTDTHWNNYGAHLAAQRLLEVLAGAGVPVTPPRDENLTLELQERPQTDLINLLGLTGHLLEQEFILADRSAREATVTVLPLQEGQTADRPSSTCETGSDAPRFLLVQDSFGVSLSRSLCKAFSHGVSVWDSRIREEYLEAHQPAVVVLEVVERYLGVLTNRHLYSTKD